MGEVHVTPTRGTAALDTDRSGQTCKRQNAAKEQHAGNTLSDYYQLLRESRCFRIIWIGEVTNNCGAWFNFVATIDIIQKLAGESGLLISLVVIMRLLPTLFLFPAAGVVADRFPRENILIISNVIAGVVAACLTFITTPHRIWLLYVLLFLQFSCNTFYDPARRALVPTVVPAEQLPLATTLDSFAWSLMGAFGASLGGLAVSHVGPSLCFLIDAATYAVAAWCAYHLKGILAEERASSRAQASAGRRTSEDSPLKGAVELTAVQPAKLEATAVPEVMQSRAAELESATDLEEQTFLIQARQASHQEAGPHEHEKGRATPEAGGLLQAVTGGFAKELAALREGMLYISAPRNRDAAAITFIKASGAIVWGASDNLQVRFSTLPSMQSLGDSATTLGLLFAAIGVGCFIGPVISNKVTPTRKHYLLRACAASFVMFFVGYLLMAAAPNIWLLLPSTVVRSCGSSIVWVYSTLLIQLRVPNQLQGRMMALEMAFYVVAESSSALFGAYAFDGLRMGVRSVALLMAGLSGIICCPWILYAWCHWPRKSGAAMEQQVARLAPEGDVEQQALLSAQEQHASS